MSGKNDKQKLMGAAVAYKLGAKKTATKQVKQVGNSMVRKQVQSAVLKPLKTTKK